MTENGVPQNLPESSVSLYAESAATLKPEKKIDPDSLKRTAYLIFSVILADIFLYDTLGAVTYGVLIIIWAAGIWYIFTDQKQRLSAVGLLILITLLGLRNIYKTGFFPAVLPLFLVCGLGILHKKEFGHWFDALIMGGFSAAAGFIRIPGHFLNLIGFFKRRRFSGCAFWAAPLSGGLIIIIIFGAIFVAANPVIDGFWEQAKTALSLDRILEKIFDLILPHPGRIFLWLVAAWFTAGIIQPLIFNFRKELWPFTGREKSAGEKPLPNIMVERTAAAVLIAACVMFFLYIAVDFVYLWVNVSLPEGITDSQYARRGACWLTFALILSAFIISKAVSETNASGKYLKIIKKSANIWIFLDLLMAVCVYKRIGFYIDRSGLTPLRITGIFGTSAVIAGIIILYFKINKGKKMIWLVRRYAEVFIIGFCALILFPLDYFSASYNVNRVMNGDSRPLMLLFTSDIKLEGLGVYTRLLDHPDPVIASGISAYLADTLNKKDYFKEARMNNKTKKSFQLGAYLSLKKIDSARDKIIKDTLALGILKNNTNNND